MGIKSELHEAILKRGGTVPPYGGIAAAMDELNKLPGGGGDCDWNIMKNRPFGEEEVYILPESELTFEMSEDLGANVAFVEFAHDLVGGEMYAVNFDGTAYNCTCVASGDDSLLLGNLAVFGGDDTGEPFVLGVIMGTPMAISFTEAQTVVVSVKGNTIKTIDPKYAPSLPVIDLVSLGCPAVTIGEGVNFDWAGIGGPNAYSVLGKGSCFVKLKVTGSFSGNDYVDQEFLVVAHPEVRIEPDGNAVHTNSFFDDGYMFNATWSPYHISGHIAKIT